MQLTRADSPQRQLEGLRFWEHHGPQWRAEDEQAHGDGGDPEQ